MIKNYLHQSCQPQAEARVQKQRRQRRQRRQRLCQRRRLPKIILGTTKMRLIVGIHYFYLSPENSAEAQQLKGRRGF